MLLVYGPRSLDYDFGAGHPLTPRRFGPGIDLLRAVGAEPGLVPEPASDEELRLVHERRYIETVRRFSEAPYGPPEAGISAFGDVPPFAGMHDAGAVVAGGSMRAMEAILRGDVEHAFHPGGGLHHAMADRASGFCIYDDVALAIAVARGRGLRVLYLDFDVHHGDGVQALSWDDPGVMTVSFHESGRYLFPGTGFAEEVGEGTAAGTAVNVPMEPATGEAAWLEAVTSLVPELAAAFGPDLIVSQHGADSHAWDPLAHLRVTTTAMGSAARLVDAVAHRFAGGRWLATGGGGYDAYRVVPRSWSLVWLAGAHLEVPDATPVAWRDAWEIEAAAYGQAPLPGSFTDAPNAGVGFDATQERAEDRSRATTGAVRRIVVPRLLREARDRGWWDPMAPAPSTMPAQGPASGEPVILPAVEASTWAGLVLAPRVTPPAHANAAHALVARALGDGASVVAAVVGSLVVGAAVTSADGDLLALGVAPAHRRAGLGGRLVGASAAVRAETGVAERDVFEPLDGVLRSSIAKRMLEGAGFRRAGGDAWVRP